MTKLSINNKGFGVLGVLAVIVVLALAGGSGVYVYHRNHKAKTVASTSSSTARKSTSTKTSTGSETSPAPDPYAGRKQFCDTQAKVCFKYSTNWTENSNITPEGSTNLVSASLESPDHAVSMSYQFPDTKDAGSFNFLTISINSVPGLPFLDVVGGVYTNAPGASDYAQYSVVSTSTVAQYGLAVGHTSQFINTPRYQLPVSISGNGQISDGDYQFIVIDEQSVNNTNYSLATAQAWFSTQNAKNGLQVLESLSKE